MNDKYQKMYDKLEAKLSSVSESDKQELRQFYKKISSNFSSSDFKNIESNPKSFSDKILDVFTEDNIIKALKIIMPFMIVLGIKVAYDKTKQFLTEKAGYDNITYNIIISAVISAWISVLMTIVENKVYFDEIGDLASSTYALFKEMNEIRKKLFKLATQMLFVELIKEYIKFFFYSWWKMILWQLEIAKKNGVYLILFTCNMIVNIMILWYVAKKGLITSGVLKV